LGGDSIKTGIQFTAKIPGCVGWLHLFIISGMIQGQLQTYNKFNTVGFEQVFDGQYLLLFLTVIVEWFSCSNTKYVQDEIQTRNREIQAGA